MRITSLIAIASLAGGCAAASGDSNDFDLDIQQQADGLADEKILDGLTASTSVLAPYGVVRIIQWNGDPGRDCSGMLMTNKVVLTAKHCLTSNNMVAIFQDTSGGQLSGFASVYPHATLDLALARLSTPFKVNGSTTGHSVPATNTAPFENQVAFCFGYGVGEYGYDPDDGHNPRNYGAGTLRYGVFNTKLETPDRFGNGGGPEGSKVTMKPITSYNGSLTRHDSGGPCINGAGDVMYVQTAVKGNEGAHTSGTGVNLYPHAFWVNIVAAYMDAGLI